MSIFGKVDAYLPLVNQAVQVDPNDQEELYYFWIRCSALINSGYIRDKEEGRSKASTNPSPLLHEENQAKKDLDLMLRTEDHRPDTYKSIGDSVLSRFKEVLIDVKTVITTLADRQSINRTALGRLRRDYYSQRQVEVDLGHKSPNKAPSNYYLTDETPFKYYKIAYKDSIFAPERELIDELEDTLVALLRAKIVLRKCDECQFPFTATRVTQQFCSHRCADRVSKRRQRNKTMSD